MCFLLSGLTWLVMEVITVLPATLWEACVSLHTSLAMFLVLACEGLGWSTGTAPAFPF